jgi:hypothetical protein
LPFARTTTRGSLGRARAKQLGLLTMLITRSALLRVAALLPAALPSRPAAAYFGEVTGDGFYQADDKSWDVTLPSSWQIDSTSPRAAFPEHVFSVRAQRKDGSARLTVLVDKINAKSLAALGDVSRVGTEFAARLPKSELVAATKVAGVIKGSYYYDFAFRTAEGRTRQKLGLQQERLYQLTVDITRSTPALEAEVDAVLESFKCFPVNIICTSQSNSGKVPVAGSCY